MEEHPIFAKPIEFIATSEEFLLMCNQNNFKTIGQIIEWNVNELLQKPEFNLRMLIELNSILKSYNLDKYIKE